MIRKIIKEDDYRHRHHPDVERLQRVMLQNSYVNGVEDEDFELDDET